MWEGLLILTLLAAIASVSTAGIIVLTKMMTVFIKSKLVGRRSN